MLRALYRREHFVYLKISAAEAGQEKNPEMDRSEAKQESALEQAARRARAEVNRRAMLSAGATLLPIPGLDVAVDMTALVSMLNAVNREFVLSPDQIERLNTEQKVAIFTALDKVRATFAGKYVTGGLALTVIKQLGTRWAAGKAARWVPVVGQGAAAAVSFAAFKWLGEAQIQECLSVREEAAALLPPPPADTSEADFCEEH